MKSQKVSNAEEFIGLELERTVELLEKAKTLGELEAILRNSVEEIIEDMYANYK